MRGAGYLSLDSRGDNPTAQAKAGERDEALDRSRSNAVDDAGWRWGPGCDPSSQGHVAGNWQNSPIRDHRASLRIAAECSRARPRGDPYGHRPGWPAHLGHDIVRQQRQQGTVRLGAVLGQQDHRGRRFRRLLPNHTHVGRPVREMLRPKRHGAAACHRCYLLHDGSGEELARDELPTRAATTRKLGSPVRLEVHRAFFSQSRAAQKLTVEKDLTLSLGPPPDDLAASMFLNRSMELNWIALRLLPYMRRPQRLGAVSSFCMASANVRIPNVCTLDIARRNCSHGNSRLTSCARRNLLHETSRFHQIGSWDGT